MHPAATATKQPITQPLNLLTNHPISYIDLALGVPNKMLGDDEGDRSEAAAATTVLKSMLHSCKVIGWGVWDWLGLVRLMLFIRLLCLRLVVWHTHTLSLSLTHTHIYIYLHPSPLSPLLPHHPPGTRHTPHTGPHRRLRSRHARHGPAPPLHQPRDQGSV